MAPNKKTGGKASQAGEDKAEGNKAAAAAAASKVGGSKPASSSPKGKKQQRDEIDDLFGGLKEAKKQKAAEAVEPNGAEQQHQQPAEGKVANKQQESKKVEGSKDDLFGTEAAKGRKRTEEGYAIYDEEELGLAKYGGNTPLCPFDCDCCF